MINSLPARMAFTLIELLIVIAIIAILAAILFTSIGQSPLQQSRDTKRVSDLDSMRTALALYYNANDQYPATGTAALRTALVPTYIPDLPTDPRNSAAGCATAGYTPNFPDAAGYAALDYGYSYAQESAGQGYRLQACLEQLTNKALTGDCDTGTCSPAGTNVYDIHS